MRFVSQDDAMPVLMVAYTSGPRAVQEFLERGEPDNRDLFERILSRLSVFDEHNTDGHYESIRRTLTTVPRYQRLFQLSAAQGVGAGTLGAWQEKLSSGVWRLKNWSMHVCN